MLTSVASPARPAREHPATTNPRAHLTSAVLANVSLLGANLGEANLSGADLSYAEELVRAQIDGACADPDNPPGLNEFAVDRLTGEPLVWQGKPCDGKA